MTEEQFDAMAQLMRLRKGSRARATAHLVLVAGMSTPEASRVAGLDYPTAHQAVKRVRAGLVLARKAAGAV